MRAPPTSLNTLIIHHRGKCREFRLVKGGFAIRGGCISISIETRAEDGDAPYSALFSLVNYPIGDRELEVGRQIALKDDHANGWDDQTPHANAYFDFHAEKVRLTFKFLTVTANLLTVRLSARTNDYGFDAKRKVKPMVGVFELPKTNRRRLWIPT